MEFLQTIFSNAWYWLIPSAMLIGLEIFVPGVYLIWIGCGMLVTGISMLIMPALGTAWQLVIFILAMLGSILMGVTLQQRTRKKTTTILNAGPEQHIGKYAIAAQPFMDHGPTQEITKTIPGRIWLEDTTYSAVSNTTLSEGDQVEILGYKSGSFLIKPTNDGRGKDD